MARLVDRLAEQSARLIGLSVSQEELCTHASANPKTPLVTPTCPMMSKRPRSRFRLKFKSLLLKCWVHVATVSIKPVIENWSWGEAAWAKASRGEERQRSAARASGRGVFSYRFLLIRVSLLRGTSRAGQLARPVDSIKMGQRHRFFPHLTCPHCVWHDRRKGRFRLFAARRITRHDGRGHPMCPSAHCSLPESGRV